MKNGIFLKIKSKLDQAFKHSRLSFVLIFYFACLLENFIIRMVLSFKEIGGLSNPILDLPKIIFFGLYNDSINFGYVAIPITIYLVLVPNVIYYSRFQKILAYLFTFLVIAIFSFQAHAEWFFWNEFSTRFNFIAVDYLVYSKEVLGNIRESYPMHWVYTSVIVFSAVIYLVFLKCLKKIDLTSHRENFSHRAKVGAFILVFPLTSFFVFENFFRKISDNQMVNELSYNGLYQLIHAFRHNELDYDGFFATIEKNKMWDIVGKQLTEENVENKISKDNLLRIVKGDGPEKKLNVMFVTVESFAASFMQEFGNKQGITPHLDALINNSMFFTNIYATGNRTIRGMEALTLSIPPTPGYSIVKRPKNDNLYSVGKVFKEKGYENKFIYGGYGYFDNMNEFFGSNHFEIVDRNSFKEGEFVMANIWGVDDESLFNKAIQEADKSYKAKKPFFSFVMTTTNHRPFTYPDGRIDIPSHTSREGAVKYTDYAINKLLKDAESKPWFKDTIFVIVADHGVGGRGKTEIPMGLYHIPFFIYSPKHVKPLKVDRLASQIDVVPTLLSLLNFNYESKFFGKNILKMKETDERALVGTYSTLGYFEKGILLSLGVNRAINFNFYDPKTLEVKNEKPAKNQEILDNGISYYQSASFLWQNGLLKGN